MDQGSGCEIEKLIGAGLSCLKEGYYMYTITEAISRRVWLIKYSVRIHP